MVVQGCVHKLIIKNVTGEDEAEYSMSARGSKTTASLFVEGKTC